MNLLYVQRACPNSKWLLSNLLAKSRVCIYSLTWLCYLKERFIEKPRSRVRSHQLVILSSGKPRCDRKPSHACEKPLSRLSYPRVAATAVASRGVIESPRIRARSHQFALLQVASRGVIESPRTRARSHQPALLASSRPRCGSELLGKLRTRAGGGFTGSPGAC